MTATTHICCVCSQPELPSDRDPARKTELRPYGPDGAPICFPCAMKAERVAETERQFIGQVDAASEGGGVAVLTKDGPKPLGDVEGGYGIAILPTKGKQ